MQTEAGEHSPLLSGTDLWANFACRENAAGSPEFIALFPPLHLTSFRAMRTPLLILALGLLVLRSASPLPAQGPLTPPGAPAPTMKTLDQLDAKLEKRTPISNVPFTIGASGSYYLTGNLAVGTAGGSAITISADQVTLDLNGFTISSTASPASGTAVLINGVRRNVTVTNGHIRGTTTFAAGAFTTGGFLDGVASLFPDSANLRVSDLNVFGMGDDGIELGFINVPTFVVERCNVSVCAGRGIYGAVIRDCTAGPTGDTAIAGDIVTNCSGETVNTASAFADGISGNTVETCRGISVSATGVEGITVNNSRGTSNSASGLFGTNVTNSYGISNSSDGIGASNVTNSYGTSSSGEGLSATNATNSFGISSSGVGLSAANATNCFGFSASGTAGLDANPGTASFCRGQRTGGIAISAGIAIGCTVVTGTVSSLNKFLGTP